MASFFAFTTAVILLVVDASLFNLRNKVVPSSRQQQTRTFVAFSAGLTHGISLTENTSVAFDRVWSNAGDGYDSNTGIFTCPHTGVYVFICHGLSKKTGQMWLEFYKNNAYELSGFAHNTADFAYTGNSVTLPLIDGDQVYIRGHGSSQLYGQPDEIYATFTGFILTPSK